MRLARRNGDHARVNLKRSCSNAYRACARHDVEGWCACAHHDVEATGAARSAPMGPSPAMTRWERPRPTPRYVIPAARRDDRYARGVGGAAAREINKIPAALPNENGQWTGPLVLVERAVVALSSCRA